MATIVTRAGKGSALSHNEVDANFTNLNSDKLEANSNITVADATVTGDLTVQGTTTTLNTATLQVEDKNITLNYSTGDSSGSADGAGITIQDAVSSSTDATILWDATNDTFDFSHALQVQGLVDIASGEIGLKNSGSVSNIKFYCEVSNAHYTALQSSPHSAYSGNVTLTLPPATDTLVGRATTDTLTNKTLTSPDVNTPDIDGGTIDGTVIGGSTAAAGTFTTFTSTGIDDNASSTAITIDSSENVGIGGDGNAKLEVFGPLASPSLGTYANSAAIISTTAGGYGMSFSVDGTGTGYIQAQNFTSSAAYGLSLNYAGGTVSVGGAVSGTLQLNGASSGNEGGQLNIVTAGSLGTYSIDAHTDDMRFLNGTTAGNYVWYTNSNAGIAMTLSGAGDLSVSGKLTITDSAYDNHLELNRSNEQWRISPSTDGSLDIRRIGGTGTAYLDVLDLLRVNPTSGSVVIGPQNTGFCHFSTDRSKHYFNKPVHMDGGAVDYDTGDHFLLPNANNSESPNSSTARNGGAINYIYNRSSNLTLTRGDFAHHIIQQWSHGPTFTLTSSTFQRGDIVEFINVKGAVTITVVGTIIYLPNGSNDTTLTLSQAGKFRLVRYSSNAGYWMVG